MILNNLLKYFGYFTIILGFLTLGAIIYLQNFPTTVFELTKPIEILNDNKTVEAGGILKYKTCYKKYYNLTAKVTYQLVNNVNFLVDTQNSNIKKGEGCFVAVLSIPSEIYAGTYRMRASLEYSVSPFKTVTEVFETERFTVTPSKDALTIQKLNIEIKKLIKEQEDMKKVQRVHSFTTADNNSILRDVKGILKNQEIIMEKLEK